MAVASLDLELDVFAGPFDLLLAVVLREEVSLLEVDLSDIVLAYIEHLEREDELDLEVATEFLVLIASLLELKSRLLLPGAEELGEVGPEEAVEELVARMLEYRRYRDAAAMLSERFDNERGYLYRSAPLPADLRRVSLDAAKATYDPELLGSAIGDLRSAIYTRAPCRPNTIPTHLFASKTSSGSSSAMRCRPLRARGRSSSSAGRSTRSRKILFPSA